MKLYYDEDGITIYHGDCREILPHITADVMVTDPPYGVTDHAWDKVVPAVTWMSAATTCVSFASEPFATDLIVTAPLAFRYDFVWVKNTASNTLNAARQPLRQHERVLVFGRADYYPQLVRRTEKEIARLNSVQRQRGALKYPGSVLTFPAVNCRSGDRTQHPSQKPERLMRWLVASYTATDQVVLDPFTGSGSTLVAAKNLGRRAIGIEIDERYCEVAVQRLAQMNLDLVA
jgi:DNA modification methylase